MSDKKIFTVDEAEDLAKHPNTPKTTLSNILTQHGEQPHVVQAIAQHPNADPNILHRVFQTGLDDSVLEHPDVSPKTVNEAFDTMVPKNVADIDYSDHSSIINHPKLDSSKRDKVINDILSQPPEEDDDFHNHNLIIGEYVKNNLPTREMADKIMLSPHKGAKIKLLENSNPVDDTHLNSFLADAKTGRADLYNVIQNQNLSSDQVRKVWQKHEELPEGDDTRRHYRDEIRSYDLVNHPNTPYDVLKGLINNTGEDHRDFESIRHKNFPLEEAKQIYQENKDHWGAKDALLNREDLDEPTLRQLDSEIEDVGKYGTAHDIIKHPNYPLDLQMKRAKSGGAYVARTLLKNPDLHHDVLKQLLNNKNTGVAIDALHHKNITPDLVMEAYKRKANDVSAAAASHPMLPQELKMKKVLENPKAAVKSAGESEDPEILKAIASSHLANQEVRKKLINNPHLDPETLHDLISEEIHNPNPDERHAISNKVFARSDLPKKTVEALSRTHNGALGLVQANNPNISSNELKAILDHHKNNGEDVGSLAGNALSHDSLTPELAKDILSGNYGHIAGWYGDRIEDQVKNNPEVFNRDAVKAALNTPAEFIDHNLVSTIAKHTPHLTAKEIEQYVKNAEPIKQSAGMGRDEIRHKTEVANALLENQNADPKLHRHLVEQHITSNGQHYNDTVASAIASPHYPSEHAVKMLTDPATVGISDIPFEKLQPFKDKLKSEDPELAKKVMRETPYQRVAQAFISSKYGDIDGKLLMEALKNPNPDVIKAVLDNSSVQRGLSGGYMPGIEDKGKFQQEIDKLAESEDPEIREATFQYASPDAQRRVAGGQNVLHNPSLLRGLKRDAVAGLKVEKDTPIESMKTILNHPGLTWQHMYDMVDHSQTGAEEAFKKVSEMRDSDDRKSPEDKRSIEHIEHKFLENYPNHPLARHIASETHNKSVMDKITQDPKLSHLMNSLINNEKAKTEHLDQLVGKVGPTYEDAMRDAASHSKTSVKLLAHIAKNYPELLRDIVDHPKAHSPKVLSYLLNSKDEKILSKLADNPKVPEEVRNQLYKDPNILLSVRDTSLVSPEALKPLALSSDPEIVKKVVGHKSGTPEIIDEAVSNAMRNFTPEQKEDIIAHTAAYAQTLSPKTQKTILDNGTSYDFHSMVKNQTGEDTPLDNDVVSEGLDKYQGDSNILGELIHSMTQGDAHTRNLKPEIYKKIVDQLDLNKTYTYGYNHQNGSWMARAMVSKKPEAFKDEDYEKLIGQMSSDKVKAQQEGSNIHKMSQDHGLLLSTIANYASPRIIDEKLIQYPQLTGALLENDNLSKESYDRLVDSLGTIVKNKKQNMHDKPVEGVIENMIDHRHATPDALDKIYKKISSKSGVPGDDNPYKDQIDKLAKSPMLSDKLLEKMVKDGVPGSYSNPKVSEDLLHSKLDDLTKNYTDTSYKSEADSMMESIASIMANPKMRLGKLTEMINKNYHIKNAEQTHWWANYYPVYRDKIKEVMADPEDLKHATDLFLSGNIPQESQSAQGMIKAIIEHYDTPEESLNRLMDVKDPRIVPESAKKQIFGNPKVGGKLWREKKHSFPDAVKGLKTGKEINKAEFAPQIDKLQTVKSMVPQDGYIEWANFKKDQPSLAGNPVVQKMFTSAPKQRLTAEHADKYINELPKKEFHVSYTVWGGIQRHNGAKQLVVQINNGPSQDEMMQKDPEIFRFYKMIQKASTYSSHPTNPQSIGWSRVDTSNKDHWFIDEIQSDFNSNLSKELAEAGKQGANERIKENFGLESEQVPKVVSRVMDMMHGWDKAVLDNIIQTAKAHGVKKVSIHSGQSKTLVNKGEKSEVTNKYDKIYNKLPESMGFKKDIYDNIASASTKGDLRGEPIWTLQIPQETKKAEMTYGRLTGKSVEEIQKIVGLVKNNKEVLQNLKKADAGKYQAVLDSVRSLVELLREAGYISHEHSAHPHTDEAFAREDEKAQAAEAQAQQQQMQPGQMPQQKKDEPLHHKHGTTYGPGAVRQYEGSDVRQKDPSGQWKHISLKGDE